MKLLVITLLFSSLTLTAQQTPEPKIIKTGDQVEVTLYHDNGVVAQQGFIKNNKLHGQWVSYDTNGNKSMMGVYSNGAKTGKWLIWSSEGIIEVDYNNNTPGTITRWGDPSKRVVTNE